MIFFKQSHWLNPNTETYADTAIHVTQNPYYKPYEKICLGILWPNDGLLSWDWQHADIYYNPSVEPNLILNNRVP